MPDRHLSCVVISRGPLLAAALTAFYTAAALAQATPPLRLQQQCPPLAAAGTALPIEPRVLVPPARSVRFTTTEGTWMSVDVAPNGQTLVFDLLGDLYTLPLAGGRARRLTSGPAIDGQPRFSPDGRSVVFTSDRSGTEQVWRLELSTGAFRQISDEVRTSGFGSYFASPIWVERGAAILVSRVTSEHAWYDARSDIVRYPAQGRPGPGTRLGFSKQQIRGRKLGPAIGPDERYLWYSDGFSIKRFDRTTRQDTVVIAGREDSRYYVRPVVSPDGRWLAYGAAVHRFDQTPTLRVRNLTTGAEHEVVSGLDPLGVESMLDARDAMPGYAFLPDSRTLVLTVGGKLWRVAVPDGKKTPIPFVVEVDQTLGPLLQFKYPTARDSLITARQIKSPQISPDGKRLLFMALDRVWVMSYPGGTPRRLTQDNVGERWPTWSPDGRFVAYVSWDSAGDGLFRVRSDGSGARERLSQAGNWEYRKPSYSPDGTRLVAIRRPVMFDTLAPNGSQDPDSRALLVWIPATGGGEQVIGGSSEDGRPYFVRSDSTRIYQWTTSMRWDGTDRRMSVYVDGRRSMFSPDGQYVLLNPSAGRAGNLLIARVLPENRGVQLSEPFQVVERSTDESAAWTADGQAFYYTRGATLYRYDMATLEQVLVGRGTGDNRHGDETDVNQEKKRPASASGLSQACTPTRTIITARVAADRVRGAVLLRGARVVTMRGREIIAHGDILVRNSRIAAIGRTGSLAVPAGTHVIDVTGKTIIPGLIDLHAHNLTRAGAHSVLPAGLYRGMAWEYLAPLAYGVTTQRDPQTSVNDEVFTHADMVDAGLLRAPRLFTTGGAIFQSLKRDSYAKTYGELRPYAEDYRSTVVKQHMMGDRLRRQQFLAAARALRLTPTAEGGDSKLTLSNILDGSAGHEHTMQVPVLYEDIIRLVAASGVTYTPTQLLAPYPTLGRVPFLYFRHRSGDLLADAKLRHFLPVEAIPSFGRDVEPWSDSARRADSVLVARYARQLGPFAAAGWRIGLGSHGELEGLGVHWEMWAMAAGGLSPWEVLRAATRNGAEALGRGQDLGSLAPGKLADLLVLDANPLQDIQNTAAIRYVMQNGRLYEAGTLDQVWPERQPLSPRWWVR